MRVANRRHDLVAITIADPAEDDTPPIGLLHLIDAESGEERLVDAGDARVREAFRATRRDAAGLRARLFRKYQVDSIEVRTDRPYTDALIAFFRRRERELAT